MREASGGQVVVDVLGPGETYRWETEIDDYTGLGAEAVAKGVGFDYFFDSVDFPGPGRYLVKDIVVTYFPAESMWDEADEDIEFGEVEKVADDFTL